MNHPTPPTNTNEANPPPNTDNTPTTFNPPPADTITLGFTTPAIGTTNANIADGMSHLGVFTTPAIRTTNANIADGMSHLGGRPTNHHPTDNGRPVEMNNNNVNFADGTATHLGERPRNQHPIEDGRLVGTTIVNPTNLTTTPLTINGTTNIAPNYASLLTLLATNPTDPTIAAAFIEFLQQKNNNNPNTIAPPTPTLTSIITSPGTPSYSSVTTGHHFHTPTSTNDDEEIEEEDPILSQSDVLPLRPTPTKSTYIRPSSGIITSALEEQRLAQ